MTFYKYGNPQSEIVLIQPVDARDLSSVENEIKEIERLTDREFQLIAVKIENWNRDLSPWCAPAVFGNESFGDSAGETLREILALCTDAGKRYIIGGYSLAALFALWSVYRTDVFSAAAAASPSMWFPGFVQFMRDNDTPCAYFYLSLGDREEKTRNPVMATVGDRIREAYALLGEKGIKCELEWNEGNHFKEPDIRTARAFARAINAAGE